MLTVCLCDNKCAKPVKTGSKKQTFNLTTTNAKEKDMNQHIIPLTVYNQTMQELLSLYPADRGSLSVLNHSDKMSARHNLLHTNAMNNESHYSNRCNQNGRISLHMMKHTHSQHSQGCQFSSILGPVAFSHPLSSYSLCFPFLSPPSSSSPQKVQLGSLDCAVSGQWLSDGCR